MSIWSSIAQSGWVDPQALAAMPNPGASTRDSDAGFQGSALDAWGMPGMTAGASTDAELANLGVGYTPGADPAFDAWLQGNPYAIGMGDVATPAQYAAARATYLYGDPSRTQDVVNQHLRDQGLTLAARRGEGRNAAEVGYFDQQGRQVGPSIDRTARGEGTNAELLGMLAMAAPAAYGIATAGGAAGTAGSGGLAGVDLASMPATSAGGTVGGAGAGGLLSQAELAQLAVSPVSISPASLVAGTVPSGAGAAGVAGAAGATGLAGLASSAGNALSKLATPENLLRLGGTVGSALIGSSGVREASRAQQRATDAALAEQRRQYDLTRADLYGARDLARTDLTLGQQQSRADLQQGLTGALGDYAPYQQAGRQALAQYQQALGRPVTGADVMQDPGYQFGLQQGQQALDRKIAAMGGRVSGAALKAAGRYGTDYASTGYNAAYQRRQDSLNRLAQLAGMGQQSAGQSAAARLGTAGAMSAGSLGTAGQIGQNQFQAAGGAAGAGANRANAISNLVTSQGDAMGGAALAQSNLWGNAGNQLAALYGRRQTPTYGYPYPGP